MERLKGQQYFDYLDMKVIHKRLHEDAFPFSQNLMWDYPLENIDLKKHRRYVVERVVARGFLSDFYIMLQLYSKDEISDSLTKSKELDKKTARFCEFYFDLPKNSLNVSSFYGRD